MSQFYQVFFDETAEHLANMESLLLALDLSSPSDDELNGIFRCAHSIKGGSGTFGFTDMAEVTHVLETLLDKIRKHELAPTSAMVDAFLKAGDVIRAQLAAHRGEGAFDPAMASEVCAVLERLGTDAQATDVRAQGAPAQAGSRVLRIVFAAKSQSIVENLLGELRALGELVIDAEPKPRKGRKAKPGEWRMRLTTAADTARVTELIDFVADADSVEVSESADDKPGAGAESENPGYGFFDGGSAATQPKQQADGFGFFDDAPGLAGGNAAEADPGYGFFEPVPAAAAEPQPAPPTATVVQRAQNYGRRATDQPGTDGMTAGRRQNDKAVVSAGADSSIRVSIEKVDQLINLVGELVITQAMLAQTTAQVDPVVYEKMLNGLAQLERNTRDLQESVMGIRMMPISFVFSRFPRVVRDVASKLGKQVELKTVGEGTELDKGVIERIADPLTHLVRNSLDHGIETPEARVAAGKPEKGTVTLRAYHQGGNIIVEVADDGRGLNRDKILAKARERGMSVAENISDQDVFKLIFAPGFSTAEVVTDVSGRGVGMDVVKRNIEGMGGRVEIDSELGAGTRITIRLPLTLAILDGLSVQVGKEIYIIPLTYITESLQPRAEAIRTVGGTGNTVRVRGEYLPVLSAAQVFGVRANATDLTRTIMVIMEAEGTRIALAVDGLVSQHQVVIKSLETNYRKVYGVSGATIMGDGRVALILDVAALVRLTRNDERRAA
jgi:two-component system chemotaxis sensor kinase CheA